MEKIMKKQKGQYKNNNKIQINKILNAAEKLFIEKGIKSKNTPQTILEQ